MKVLAACVFIALTAGALCPAPARFGCWDERPPLHTVRAAFAGQAVRHILHDLNPDKRPIVEPPTAEAWHWLEWGLNWPGLPESLTSLHRPYAQEGCLDIIPKTEAHALPYRSG
jgi:hypothetical protein